MKTKRVCHLFVTFAALVGCLAASAPSIVTAQDPPEIPEAIAVSATGGMVAADHPEASRIGADILKKGGNAVDASVATLLALGVLNPFASGLGGGGFCLVKPTAEEAGVLDFRERAPGRAHRDMYLVDGKADIGLTMTGGLAVGVPGEALGLETLHKRYGKLPWKDVVEPARKLAANGFVVGELLPKRLAHAAERLAPFPDLMAEFQRNGKWVAQGDRLARPELGKALKLLRDEGAAPFYTGKVAEAIVETANAAGGIFTAEDLARYQVTWREPLRGTYRGYQVIAMPPPSSGGTTILTALNILERYDLRTLGQSTESTHRVIEAMKHAFADRAKWLGDADFVDVPVTTLVSKQYASGRVVRPDGVLPAEQYGLAAAPPDDSGTSHVSVIDDAGMMTACTSTVNTSFGSKLFVKKFGIVLNNEMGDFSAQPGVPNNYGLIGTEQNAVAPGKRPLSSMSPTLLLTPKGEPFMSVGASGGPTIISGTLLAILRIVDWNTTPADAVTLPRLHHQLQPDLAFAEAMDPARKAVLEARGHKVKIGRAYNSVQLVIRKDDGTLVGVSDSRKNGRPAGVKEQKQ